MQDTNQDTGQLREDLLKAVDDANDLGTLEALRVDALGKKGRITAMMKGLGAMDPEARTASSRTSS